jgi:Integrase core domain
VRHGQRDRPPDRGGVGWTNSARQFPLIKLPRCLPRGRDAIFGNEFREQVLEMGICKVLSAPRSPWQRAYIERQIGSIRRECLDHVIVFHESSLRRTLHSYFEYFIGREHLSPWRRTRRSQERFSRPKWDPWWRDRRLLDCITATNDGLNERARTHDATGCLCSAVSNLSPKYTPLHTRVSARVDRSANCLSFAVQLGELHLG